MGRAILTKNDQILFVVKELGKSMTEVVYAHPNIPEPID